MRGRGREFWAELVGEVAGGASVAAVARRYRVQPKTLSWWRWRLRSETSREPLLLPVVMRDALSSPAPAESVELRVCDVLVRVAVGTDVNYVAALVSALRGEC